MRLGAVARFYASAAPDWWPYQIVSLGNRRLPQRRLGYYSILADNGMFRYYSKLGERPKLSKWFADLRRFLYDVERLRRPREILVILPDWLYDYQFTIEAAKSRYARELCERYMCFVAVHVPRHPTVVNAYQYYAESYATIDWVHGLAAPLKLNCSYYSGKAMRRVIRLHCQRAVAEQVCAVARQQGLECHGLGVALKPEHIRQLVDLGMTSFDSTSWTRPNNTAVARTARWSAKNKTEKETFFTLVLRRLLGAGVVLESAEAIPA